VIGGLASGISLGATRLALEPVVRQLYLPSRVYSKRRGLPPFMKPIVALRPPSAERSYTIRFG
jgi:hypothetical protein